MKYLILVWALITSFNVFSATYIVAMSGMKFVPQYMTIKKGDRIKFINMDSMVHDVKSNGNFKSPVMFKNDKYLVDFDREGSYDYFCTLHIFMKGQIKVE